MATRKLEVQIIGDARSLERAFGRSGTAASGFGSKLTHLAKVAVFTAGAAGIGGLALTLRAGWKEMEQASLVSAQTAAVLKSTGGAANVTAKQVDTLATSIMRYSGMDDEAVKSAENMLLTFRQIQNRVGKNNDVFTQATKVTADLSVAMGMDMTKAALQVGKALNDPEKGMTRLQRIGVTFTDEQKKLVAALVKTGDVAGAQKVILGELTKEFGGSAKAAGDTLPGQLNKLRETFNNLAGSLLVGMVPALTGAAEHLTGFLNKIQDAHGVSGKLGVVFDTLKSSVVGVGNGIKDAFATIDWQAVGNTILDGLRSALAFLGSINYGAYLKSGASAVLNGLVGMLHSIPWGELGQQYGSLFISTLNKLSEFIRSVNWNNVGQALIEGIKTAIVGLSRFLAGVDWMGVLGALFRGVTAVLKAVGSLALGLAEGVGKLILDGLGRGLRALVSETKAHWQGVIMFMLTLPGTLGSIALDIGRNIVTGILNGLGDLASKVGGKIKDGLLGGIHAAGGILHGSGEFQATKHLIGEPLAQGITLGFVNGMRGFSGVVSDVLNSAFVTGSNTIRAWVKQVGGLAQFKLPTGLQQAAAWQDQKFQDESNAALMSDWQAAIFAGTAGANRSGSPGDRDFLAGLPGFANGGVVGGRAGAPQLAVVHGGETVIPRGGGRVGGDIYTTVMLDGQVVGKSVQKWAAQDLLRGGVGVPG